MNFQVVLRNPVVPVCCFLQTDEHLPMGLMMEMDYLGGKR